MSFEKYNIDDFVVAELALPFEKCNIDGFGVAEITLRLRETSAKHLDDLATPNKALCRKAEKEEVFGIFFLIMVSPAIGGIEPF